MHVLRLIRKDHWPLYLATAVLLIPVITLGYHLLQTTHGAFSLPRDEAFLQLSIAKTLAFHRTWGICRYDFSAASPSLLYPLALALSFFICGVYLVIIPVINTLIAVIFLTAVEKWLIKRFVRPVNRLLILLAAVLLTPLPLMVMYGMERPLLLLFAFLFVSRLADEWTLPEFSRRTLLYGALMVAAGYNGVFLVAGVCVLLLWRRKWLEAFELALWCLLPILVFGIIALYKGSYFLPNVFMLSPVGSLLSYDWLVGCGLAVMAPLLGRALGAGRTAPDVMAAGGTASYGITPRRTIPGRRWIGASAIAFTICFLTTRNLYAYREDEQASIRIYRQEYPIIQFFRRYYYRHNIVADDVGLISFRTDGRYLDLSGLGSPRIARSRVDHSFNPGFVHELVRKENSHIAVVSGRYDKALPENWIRTAEWVWPGQGGYEKRTLSFYALDSAMAKGLRENMEEYTPLFPRDLTIRYFYSPPPEK